MNSELPKALEFHKNSCIYALDLAKQFLTLAVGGIAFLINLVYADKSAKLPLCLVEWIGISFFVSAVAGFIFQMHVIGKVRDVNNYDVNDVSCRIAMILQMVSFAAGIILFGVVTVPVARASSPCSTEQPSPVPNSAAKVVAPTVPAVSPALNK